MQIQIDDEIQTASKEEIAIIKEIQSAPSIEAKAKAIQEARLALFEKLGLTSEEAALLL